MKLHALYLFALLLTPSAIEARPVEPKIPLHEAVKLAKTQLEKRYPKGTRVLASVRFIPGKEGKEGEWHMELAKTGQIALGKIASALVVKMDGGVTLRRIVPAPKPKE